LAVLHCLDNFLHHVYDSGIDMSNTRDNNDGQLNKLATQSIPRLIIGLGIPTTISMLITTLYNLADTYFVSSLGTSQSGAVGVVFALMAVFQAFGFMYGQGAGSIISRRFGAGDDKEANTIGSLAFFLAIVTGIIIALIGMIFLEPFMKLLGSTGTILVYSREYAKWVLLAAPFMIGSNVLNNILRYEGKAFLAMIGLAAGAVLNIIGDPVLIYGLGLGIDGAGISTAASQMIGFFILLYMFIGGKSKTILSFKNIIFDFSRILDICATGLPSLIRQGMASVSTMVLNYYAARFGQDAAVAAMSIVGRVNFFTFAVGLGIGQGFQPVAAFNYGAGQYKRVKKGFYFTWAAGQAIILLFMIVGIPLAGEIVTFFRNDPEVIAVGEFALRMQLAVLVFCPLSVCSNMLLQSTGQKFSASFLSLLKNGLYFIPLMVILANSFGILGVQIAQPISDVLTVLTCIPFTISFLKKLG